jgi:phosphoglycerate dehydrogenase-like enzyme
MSGFGKFSCPTQRKPGWERANVRLPHANFTLHPRKLKMQLGMIGLGRMGGNIVRRLMKHGHTTVVYDKDPKAVAARTAPSPPRRWKTSSTSLRSREPPG